MVTMAKRDIWCAFHSHGFERVSKCLLHAYPIAQVVAREKGMPLSFVMELLTHKRYWTSVIGIFKPGGYWLDVIATMDEGTLHDKLAVYADRMWREEAFASAANLLTDTASGLKFSMTKDGIWSPKECRDGKHGFVILKESGTRSFGPDILRIAIDNRVRDDADVQINPYWDRDVIEDTCVYAVLRVYLSCYFSGERDGHVQ